MSCLSPQNVPQILALNASGPECCLFVLNEVQSHNMNFTAQDNLPFCAEGSCVTLDANSEIGAALLKRETTLKTI